jgi:membrane associated rhomboid family serine protease
VFFFFLPLGTTRPKLRVPWVTYGLMVVNGVVMLYQLAQPDTPLAAFVPAAPSLWGWFASTFVHAGPLHLAGNMFFLWLFGTVAEDMLGPWLFLGFYFGGSLGATLLDWLVSAAYTPNDLIVPRIGASGAIAGIMGLSAVCFMRTKVRTAYVFWIFVLARAGVADVPAPLFLGLWIGKEVFWGLVNTTIAASGWGEAGGVAHWAHVGGFAVGLLAALALGLRKRVSRDDLLTGRAGLEDTSGFFSQAGELERVVTAAPGDAESWAALGRAQEISGRVQRAAESYGHALELFLRQRSFPRAAEAYAAMKEYSQPDALPADLLFDLGCALEECGHAFEAVPVFRLAAEKQQDSPVAETALIRAGDLARRLREDDAAAEAFRALLQRYPFSTWAGRAQEGLRAMGLPETPPAPKLFTRPPIDPDLKTLESEE